MKKTACVTGAGRGLGLGIARKLAENGFLIFCGDLSFENSEFQSLKQEYPGQIVEDKLDVTSMDNIKCFKKMMCGYTDSLDLLVNNAGILGERTLTINDELDYDIISRTIDCNALGSLRMINMFNDLVKAGDMKLILNISSKDASIANCERADFPYCMSKAALNMALALAANGLEESRIKILAVHPGWLRTYLYGEKNMKAELEPEEAAGNIMSLIERRDEFPFTPLNFINADGTPINY